MTWPMILLAVGSVASGGLLAIGGTLEQWLEPVVGTYEAHHVIPVWLATTVILATVAVGVAVAVRMYGRRPVPAEAPEGSALAVAARKDLYGDAVNEELLMRPGARVTAALVTVDDKGLDGGVTGFAEFIGRISQSLRRTQTGFARSYALSMLAGTALVVAVILAVQLW